MSGQGGTLRPRAPDAAEAVRLMDAGAVAALAERLAAQPGLVARRLELDGPDPGAYFRAPRLLWFVAENPVRTGAMPRNAVAVAQTVIAAARAEGAPDLGADLDTTLGLVASGRIAREEGQQAALIAALVAEGAQPDHAMRAALAHRERAAAEALLAAGAALTLPAAAGLGRTEAIPALAEAAGEAALHEALSLAACNGAAAAVTALLARGADPDRYNPEGVHAHSAPLHQAVSIGAAGTVAALLAGGADPYLPDRVHGGDAWAWAQHCGHPEILALLPPRRHPGG
ncbi:hypothetical protein LNKW23_35620 [Paralimibaculum aggregatum]|uniref:Ankyrin repeat domain-containing protein n=1 Tax=Paralimibaculum aggregatum TaxID=3036245 RepID=A0ABQ6LMB3_9RHOB|nr:hypothetical protein [Limibaculum sp. NKW23]GMG84347.1 hypothetical protein LNKW23_35620 [Limibaculum sp. NKW23]